MATHGRAAEVGRLRAGRGWLPGLLRSSGGSSGGRCLRPRFRGWLRPGPRSSPPAPAPLRLLGALRWGPVGPAGPPLFAGAVPQAARQPLAPRPRRLVGPLAVVAGAGSAPRRPRSRRRRGAVGPPSAGLACSCFGLVPPGPPPRAGLRLACARLRLRAGLGFRRLRAAGCVCCGAVEVEILHLALLPQEVLLDVPQPLAQVHVVGQILGAAHAAENTGTGVEPQIVRQKYAKKPPILQERAFYSASRVEAQGGSGPPCGPPGASYRGKCRPPFHCRCMIPRPSRTALRASACGRRSASLTAVEPGRYL